MLTKNLQKSPMKFYCEKCNYKCNKQSEYNKHLLTAKHEKLTNLTKKSPKISNPYMCCNCNKVYKSRMGLWQHKQKCILVSMKKSVDNALDVKNSPDMIDTMLQLIKQNQDFKELIVELSRKDTTTNNTFNNTTGLSWGFYTNKNTTIGWKWRAI